MRIDEKPSKPKRGKRNKLNAEKKVINGIEFDSKFEGQVYEALLLLEKEGIISNLELQVPIELMPGFNYGRQKIRKTEMIVDFKFKYDTFREVYFESKGMETPSYKLKLKILKYLMKKSYESGLFVYILYKGKRQSTVEAQKELILKSLNREFGSRIDKTS
jgi:hypothetical protein